MAFKFVFLCATLALANAGFIEPVAHYSSAPSVSSVSYSAPVVSKTVSYQPAVQYAQPAVHYAQPEYYSHSQPSSYLHYDQSAYVAQPKTVSTYTSSPAISHYGYEHGSSEQNIVRSAHGTVSHISKAVDTPHSSVRKYDTRIINDSPSYKVAAVSAPVYAHQQAVYAHQPAVYAHSAPAVYAHSAPVVTKTISTPVHTYAQPAVHTYAQPAVHTYAHEAPVYTKTISSAPVVHSYAHEAPVYTKTIAAAPVVHKTIAQPIYHQPAVHTYAHEAPVVKSAVQYSPAVAVSHASFEGLGAHYAW